MTETDFLTLLLTGKYLPAIGVALIAIVSFLRSVLGQVSPWFKTKPGGYAVGFGSATLLYVAASLQAGAMPTLATITAALGAGWAASGGFEMVRDLIAYFRSKGDGSPRAPLPKAIVVGLALAIGVASAASCKPWSDVVDSKPGAAVIECGLLSKGTLDSATKEIAAAVFVGQVPKWSAAYDKAKTFGRDVVGCVLAELVQSYLSGRKAMPVAESHAARDALERYRAEHVGGATFRTSAGDL